MIALAMPSFLQIRTPRLCAIFRLSMSSSKPHYKARVDCLSLDYYAQYVIAKAAIDTDEIRE